MELWSWRKKLKDRDFLENNFQISSIDFLQLQSVSTSLGLSLDNIHVSSSSYLTLLLLKDDDIDIELQQHDMIWRLINWLGFVCR
jgi:E3 ubiquitin-protein ligase BOI-like protein